jgi:hypothetical protein
MDSVWLSGRADAVQWSKPLNAYSQPAYSISMPVSYR